MSTKVGSTIKASARLQEDDALFRLQLSTLKRGSATVSSVEGVALLNVDDQAEELVKTISKHVREGRLTAAMVTLLANYLDAMESQQRWVLLGLSERHRRSSALGQETSALYAYTDALRRGLNGEAALATAYDAYFAALPAEPGKLPDTYASDCTKEKASKSRHRNLGEQRMATLIRPCLMDAKVLPASTRGRPKKATLTGGTPV